MKNLILTTLFFIVLTSCSDNQNSNNSEKFTKNLSNSIKETNEVKPTKAIEQDGNIYLIFTDGTKKQITFNQTDHEPILLKNKKQIVFVRDENISGIKSKIIMLVTIDDMKESTLSSQKPYFDGLVGTNDILAVDYPKLSLDSNYLMFVTEKYATANQLVKVNLKTGKWTELFSAESFEQITKNPYFGCFLVEQSALGENGRDIYYRLVDSTGKIIKKFSNLENMKTFSENLK